jgi:hypothetical protein
MACQVEGIIGRIGIDAQQLDGDKCTMIAKYPSSFPYSNSQGTKEMKTIFNKKDIRVYRENENGGVSKIETPDLPAEEYVFDAVVMKVSDEIMRVGDIVVKGINK